jgi:hypothetical protein
MEKNVGGDVKGIFISGDYLDYDCRVGIIPLF